MTVAQEELIKNDEASLLKRGFLFACTDKSQVECLTSLVFATEKAYGPVVNGLGKAIS